MAAPLASRRRASSKLLHGPGGAPPGAAPPRRPSVITARSLVFGAVFASVNSSANMYFNFRYSGGLSQYWVIVVSFVVFRRLSALDARALPAGLRSTRPGR